MGSVSHRRLTPKRHVLRHRVYWLLLDLAELAELDAGSRLFSHNRANLVSFYDRDHGDRTGNALLGQALAHLRAAGIKDTGVTVQLLCMPRVAGYDFNPLSVYFCRNADDDLVAVIYEVSNTFGGQHSYVIPTPAHRRENARGDIVRQACEKTFYVSPFMDLDVTYQFRVGAPDEKVALAVQARKNDCAVINTSLVGRRQVFTDRNLLRLSVTHPVLPIKVTGAILWHALKLWWRGFAINPATPSSETSVSIVRPHK
ncbi:MAG: DUF1365 domain-containing protein [Hyphomicrobiaceae bacterium]